MKKIVYLIIIFSLVSCIIPYVHKVKLTDEDLSWITHYKINDSIYYVSNTNDTDTLIVKDIQIWNPKNTFPFDSEGHNWIEVGHEYDGVASVDMSLLHSTDTFLISFDIKRNEENGPLTNSCNFCEWSWIAIPMNPKTLEIRKRKYKDCISVDIKQMDRNEGDQPHIGLKSVIWDKEKGLIQYSLLNGISYTIISAHKQY